MAVYMVTPRRGRSRGARGVVAHFSSRGGSAPPLLYNLYIMQRYCLYLSWMAGMKSSLSVHPLTSILLPTALLLYTYLRVFCLQSVKLLATTVYENTMTVGKVARGCNWLPRCPWHRGLKCIWQLRWQSKGIVSTVFNQGYVAMYYLLHGLKCLGLGLPLARGV